ncbi:MAG TPA: FIST N-terminal domain-containing protein [Nannocystis sp.]|jgi:hypothetical protein
MRVATSHSVEPDTSRAVEEAYAALVRELEGAPQWLLVQSSVRHPAEALRRAIAGIEAGAVHGSSSCLGVMTQAGAGIDGASLALFGLRDEDGSYGVGAATPDEGGDPRATAGLALQRAIAAAGRQGEVPALVWLTAAPGHEEACIAGLEAVLGPEVPVVGGSAADDAVAGGWYQLTREGDFRDAVVVSALFPSGRVVSAFQSGYTPTETRGVVTRASGRTLIEIDGQPAAAVYDAWTRGAIAGSIGVGGSVLASTSLFPLGRRVGDVGGVPYYRLAHPATVHPDGSIDLFADIEAGDELVLMHGDVEALLTRAGRVAADARALARLTPGEVAGALVIFCAGCMLTVRDRLEQVVVGLREGLAGAPFLGSFTFGEQGCFIGGENRHGNLMISVTVFART